MPACDADASVDGRRAEVAKSVRAAASDHHPGRPGDQLQVEDEAPPADVIEVDLERLVEVERGPTADLPQARQARLDHEPQPLLWDGEVELLGQPWSRPDEAHVTEHHVDDL